MIVRVKEFKGYGLLYYLDDEDEVYSDEFRVLVSKKGKCGWKRDEIINGNCSVSLHWIAVQLSESKIRRKK